VFRLFLMALVMVMSGSACANSPPASQAVSSAPENESRVISLGSARLHVGLHDAASAQEAEKFIRWVRESADIVSAYYGRFPVSEVGVNLVLQSGVGVTSGRAFQGRDMPQIIVWVGRQTPANDLRADWIMVHELIHLAMASLPRQHNWFEEGLSVYIESVARARYGGLSSRVVWREFVKRMPQGQPASGDRGLNYTSTWGRTYWGARFFVCC